MMWGPKKPSLRTPPGQQHAAGPFLVPEASSSPAEPSPAQRGRALLRTGLLVAASALGGGIAVVLYNRRLLTKMREPREPASSAWIDDE